MAAREPVDKEKHPTSLSELEQELDKEALSPEVTAVENQPDEPAPPPDDHKNMAGSTSSQPVGKPGISDQDLREATAAADATEDGLTDDNAPVPTDDKLHLSKDPDAPRPPFWKRTKFWITTVVVLLLVLLLAWFIRPSRLAMVNLLSLKAELSITTETLPEDGKKPSVLKNVAMLINGQEHQTDDQGQLKTNVPYGNTTIATTKPGYDEAAKTVLVDFDPFFYLLGGRQQDEQARTVTLQLKTVGLPLTFQTKDWLTDGPVLAGAFTVGDVVARPDDQGQVSFSLPPTDAKNVKVYAAFDGQYLNKTFELPLDGSVQEITFVPGGSDYFVSTRAGSPAVYSSNLDGSNVSQIVPPNQSESAAMNFAVNPAGTHGVVASSRDPMQDSQGTALQQLYTVNVANKSLQAVDKGIWFRFIDWAGDTLVYVVGEHTDSAITQRLASVNVATGAQTNLGTASAYGAVRIAVDRAVYEVQLSPGDEDYQNSPQLGTVPVSGGSETHLGNKVSQLTQPDSDIFVFQTADGLWHEYNANTGQSKGASAPSHPGRAFLAATSANGQYRLLVDKVDNNWALLAKNIASGKETTLYSSAGLQGPVHFAGNTVIFRKIQSGAAADYAIALGGGEPKKITDVTQPLASYPPLPGYFAFY